MSRLKMFLLPLLLLGFVLLSGLPAAMAADTTEVVNPADLSTTLGATDWHIAFTAGAATSGIVSGPATPPLGTGSLQMNTTAAADKRYIMNYDHIGTLLGNITVLAYSTYGNSTTLAPTLQLQIDPDGAGGGVPRLGGGSPVNFATLNFEPYHANTVTSGAWQSWDALTDGASVWASNIAGDAGNGTQANPATWAEFVAFYPAAVISGGFGANVGSGWATPFSGHVDELKIGYAGDTTIYDFDPAIPCTTLCYADVVNGNDLNGGASTGDAKKTIQAAVTQVSAGGTVNVAPGEYIENVTINQSLTLTGAGDGDVPAVDTILDGTTLTDKGIFIANNVTDVTIENLRVEDYKNASGSGIYANLSNHNFIVQNVTVFNNGVVGGAAGGIYMNGPVDNVLIDNVTAHNNNTRGIVIWNGFKTNITITNNDVQNNNCCGIELQDGTASGVTITGNTSMNNTDSGMSAVGLTSGAGPNLIANNTVDSNGRFGIEIKLPNGTGLDSGDGSIVVEDNDVSLTTSPTDLRDYAGIAVFRRGFVVGNNNVDIPTGVIVRDNNVSDYRQANGGSTSTGFGIVVEGTNMHVEDNTLDNNDVGVQVQAGHLPYTANTNVDGNQNNLADNYFGRGNSPVGCAAVTGNTFIGNTVDFRSEGPTSGVVNNLCADAVYVSTETAGSVAGVPSFDSKDILAYNSGTWSLFFDGSAAGLVAKHNINATHINAANDLYLSFFQNKIKTVGVGNVLGTDILHYDGSDFELYFDGSDVGLNVVAQEKIDGLHILDGSVSPIEEGCDAYLLISTFGVGKVPAYGGGMISFSGEDILGFCATNTGSNTTGFWHMVLDGSAEMMPKNSTSSISASADGETIYLTTQGAFNVDSANGSHSMVYVFDTTTGEFSGPVFSAPAAGLTQKVDALDIDFAD